MMVTEGMELTRGTKKIIQEAIDTVDIKHRNDRIRLCEEFCRIVESRYTGGAMSYQLKRMGNTYPFDLLSENGWTIQDALDNGLVIYLSNDWFFDKPLKQDKDGLFWSEEQVLVQSIDGIKETLLNKLEEFKDSTFIKKDELNERGLTLTTKPSPQAYTATLTIWQQVSNEAQQNLQNKIYWLSSLVINRDSTGTPIYLKDDELLNFTKNQAKTKGLFTGKDSNVKIPLESTGPILEAIDKYLYDKTGQYIF